MEARPWWARDVYKRQALAEDVVRGKAAVNDCTVLMRRRMEAVLKALGKGE